MYAGELMYAALGNNSLTAECGDSMTGQPDSSLGSLFLILFNDSLLLLALLWTPTCQHCWCLGKVNRKQGLKHLEVCCSGCTINHMQMPLACTIQNAENSDKFSDACMQVVLKNAGIVKTSESVPHSQSQGHSV